MLKIELSQEILDEAVRLIPETKMNRTVASRYDTIVGNIGELVFAEYLFGDWRKNNRSENKGKNDFYGLEIKCSMHLFRPNLHLLVREDYALRRSPVAYVQLLLNLHAKEEIKVGTEILFCGWAKHSEVIKREPRDFGSSFAKEAGYKCFYVPFSELYGMEKFKERYIYYLNQKLDSVVTE